MVTKNKPISDVWILESLTKQIATDELNLICSAAIDGNRKAQNYLRKLWDNESWLSIKGKLQIEGFGWYVWWMDGVNQFIYNINQFVNNKKAKTVTYMKGNNIMETKDCCPFNLPISVERCILSGYGTSPLVNLIDNKGNIVIERISKQYAEFICLACNGYKETSVKKKENKMFTKQHYKIIAELIEYRRWVCYGWDGRVDKVIDVFIEEFADYFEKDNPNFNRQKFLDACGVK